MMDRTSFDALVDQIEQQFQDRPTALTRHTWRWLLLGYVVVIGLTIAMIGIGVAMFAAGVLMSDSGLLLVVPGCCLIIFGIGQVGALLLFDHQPPQGRKLKQDEAPDLRELIDRLRTSIGSPSIDEILLTDDFNAAIMQTPRLGIFGWSQSRLILGVPLLMALSPQEFAAVLAHECGHLSHRHGRQSNQIHRLHGSWELLFGQLQENRANGFLRIAGMLLSRFLSWYWPRFHARAFVLSRQNEFVADRIAAEAVSRDAAGSALWRIECTSQMLEQKFWKDLWQLVSDLPEPPDDLCQRLQAAFAEAPNYDAADRWCRNALQRVTSNEDSHPAMPERLAAIGITAEEVMQKDFPGLPAVSAAETLLTATLPDIQAETNRQWRDSVLSIWKDRHRRAAAIRNLAKSASESDEISSLSATELWKQARNLAGVQGIAATEPLLRQLLSIQPDHTGATFVLGQLRIEQGHEDGEALLQHVVSLQTAEWTQPAAEVLERHFVETGQRGARNEIRRTIDDFEKARKAAEKERSDIRRTDVFQTPDLDECQRRTLHDQLSDQQHCQQAWLAEKKLEYFPEERLFVIAVDSNKRAGKLRGTRNDQMITALMVRVQLPGRLFVVNPTGEFRSVADRIMKEPEWKVFDRSEAEPSQPLGT